MSRRRVRGPDLPKLPPKAYTFDAHGYATGRNRLLADLPAEVHARLAPHLESVPLRRSDVLFRAREPLGDIYFPDSCVLALVSTLESGDSLEVGMVGRDGFAGTAVLPDSITMMPCDGVVVVPGVARKIRADVLRGAAASDSAVSSAISRYLQLLLARTMQGSICIAFHPVEQRLVRWLLSLSDLVDAGDVPLTHDVMAAMLGVHRPTITLAVRALHSDGIVNEQRGLIVIRDRDRLEKACCECYRALCGERKRLLGY